VSETLNSLRATLLKWLVIAIAIIAVLVVLALVVGMMLPQSHVATRTARLHRAPSDVWSMVTNVSTAPTWRTDIKAVDVLPPKGDKIEWREIASHGSMNYEGEIVRPPGAGVSGRFISRITGRDQPFGGEWTTDVASDGDGTRVTITERGEVYNPFFRFVSKFIMGHTATIDGYLRALGKHFGEDVTPVDAAPVA
jgi:hypothetical protein